MHLIKSKSSTRIHTSPSLNNKNPSQTYLTPKKTSLKPPIRPQTQRPNIPKDSHSKQNSKQSGLIARALSSAKSTIEKLIPFTKLENDKKLHVIGGKFVYHEDDLIGKGYSSNVYKGSSTENRQNKNFAIKILDLSKIKGFLLDLLRKEISIHKNLDHPNVVKCFDVIQTQIFIYLIQEYCSGGDLSHFIAQRKSKIPEGQALNMMSQISEGYKYLIREKILHRDLKPCNIFRCKMNERWKIGDFGFSCWSFEEPDDINVGTPIYMPPQSLQKSKYSHKSDIFSLGVIMYEIIYGKVPWFSKSESLLVKKMQENKINFEAQKIGINNPLIKRFIERCCEVDFDLRMNEEQFLKIQLYPKRPQQIKPLKNNLVSRTNTNIKKQQQNDSPINIVMNEEIIEKPKKQKDIESRKNSLKLITKSDSKKALTQRVNNQSCKTSQYSTEAQTRVIKDFPNSNLSSEDTYKKNGEILLKHNYFCKHLYFMIKNIEHFILSSQKKELLTIVMYKHILYMLKKLKNTKFNYFQLKKWQAYKISKEYLLFHKEVSVNFQRVESEYFRHPRRKDIKVLREVDSKFKQFDHEVEFNMKFYVKFVEWLRTLIHEFTQNLTNSHNDEKQFLKKDQAFVKEDKEGQQKQNMENMQKQITSMQTQIKDEKTPILENKIEQKEGQHTIKKILEQQVSKQQVPGHQEVDQPKEQNCIQIQALKLNQTQLKQQTLYQKISHATLQALLTMFQYYHFMNSKIANNQDVHTSYSLIDLRHNQEEQNQFSLIREYRNVQFNNEDIKRITNLSLFF